ncbi:Protein N-acetyltransferase, RimJ/RimL family [Nannocystis exedens]|uniref:Protein N-acetyltransferase, RimJ/RimL family n=1 Tax=Nannocystis exedens TaxID=54 RepID=A0A1I1U8X7_9BACT|nr:GNAT family N-acetyltransferase [Nannocystis exedens]PCC71519.1 acetyltransferase [Nannocystis exedens]SFD67292.1 Protein N-acetyltransferase, RimJ/RimL family [Nannocystis exedens]
MSNTSQALPGPSERLVFRWWTPDDLELARGLWGDPQVTARIAAEPFTGPQIAARLAAEIDQGRAHGLQYWPVFLRDDGSHVGCCGLRPHAPGVYELGFHLRSAFWGRGLAREAAAATVAFAFGSLAARGLFAGHHPDNDASRRVLLRLGFRHTHDEWYPPTGAVHPSYRRDP